MKIKLLLLAIFTLLLSSIVDGQRKKILQNGDKSPIFKFTDINGKKVSLKDFRGKYVLIDLWSTTCTPCKYQLPHLTKLKEKMEGENIVFIYISIDRDKKRWEKYVKDENLGGIQLYAGEERAYMHAYGFYTIPRFILLDKKGRIIECAMPRPSNPKMEKILTKLLESNL